MTKLSIINNRDSRYLYEVFGFNHVGHTFSIGFILANDDNEAKILSLKSWSYAKQIQKDHWGKGPVINIEVSNMKVVYAIRCVNCKGLTYNANIRYCPLCSNSKVKVVKASK